MLTDGTVPEAGVTSGAVAAGTLATDGAASGAGTLATDGAASGAGTLATDGAASGAGTLATDGAASGAGTLATDGAASGTGTLATDGAASGAGTLATDGAASGAGTLATDGAASGALALPVSDPPGDADALGTPPTTVIESPPESNSLTMLGSTVDTGAAGADASLPARIESPTASPGAGAAPESDCAKAPGASAKIAIVAAQIAPINRVGALV